MATNSELDLVITRLVRAPRTLLWEAWSNPEHLKQWWCPRPWATEVLAFDFRPGGAFHTRMRGPEGGVSDNPGCFLEIVPLARIVATSALVGDFRPAPAPWISITSIFTFADEGEDTRYTATCMHRDTAGRDQHEQMGFFDGWATCMAQLEEYARGLGR